MTDTNTPLENTESEFKVPDVRNLNVSENAQPSKVVEQKTLKTIVFCVPGNNKFNSRFLLMWSELLLQCFTNNIRPILCQENDKNLYICRNKCLGANLLSDDTEQKPFQEKLNYDYLLWIDPNVVFTFQDLKKLLASPYDVTTGIYLFNSNQVTNVVRNFDYDFYKKNGTFNFLNYDNLVDVEKVDNRYFETEFADMGWMMFKKGALEKIKYPWFEPNTTEPVSLFTDSYGYCKKMQEAGLKIMVDGDTKMRYSEL